MKRMQPRQPGRNPLYDGRSVQLLLAVAGDRDDIRQRRGASTGISVPLPPYSSAGVATPEMVGEIIGGGGGGGGGEKVVVVAVVGVAFEGAGEVEELREGLAVHEVGGDGNGRSSDERRHGQVQHITIHVLFFFLFFCFDSTVCVKN